RQLGQGSGQVDGAGDAEGDGVAAGHLAEGVAQAAAGSRAQGIVGQVIDREGRGAVRSSSASRRGAKWGLGPGWGSRVSRRSKDVNMVAASAQGSACGALEERRRARRPGARASGPQLPTGPNRPSGGRGWSTLYRGDGT